MNELETIKRAKMYVDKLAKGINPLDDSFVPEDDIINNIRISRCLFFVSDILRQIIEKEGTAYSKKKKTTFSITSDEIAKFQFSEVAVPVSKIVERINLLVSDENMKKLTHKNITDWLISIEMLQIETKPDGKRRKMPTVHGRELGIITEERVGSNGNYTAILYNLQAQQFIIDNIDAIIDVLGKK